MLDRVDLYDVENYFRIQIATIDVCNIIDYI